MQLRETAEDAVKEFLEPRERIHAVFLGHVGAPPYLMIFSFILLAFGTKNRVVAVTTKGIRVFNAKLQEPAQPIDELRFTEHARIEREPGMWSKVDIAGERLWIDSRWRNDIDRANKAMKL